MQIIFVELKSTNDMICQHSKAWQEVEYQHMLMDYGVSFNIVQESWKHFELEW